MSQINVIEVTGGFPIDDQYRPIIPKGKPGDTTTLINTSGNPIKYLPATGEKMPGKMADEFMEVSDNQTIELICNKSGEWELPN